MSVLSAAPKPMPRPKRGPKPLPKVNVARAAKREARDFGQKGAWVRRQPCCITGKRTGEGVRDPILGMVSVRVVAAHFPGRGAGGRSQDLVPLADHLHTRAHQVGYRKVEAAFGITFKELAKHYEAVWQKQLAARTP